MAFPKFRAGGSWLAFQRGRVEEPRTRTYHDHDVQSLQASLPSVLCLRLPCATMMRSAALLCVASLLPAVAGSAMDDTTIRTAVTEWLSDASAAEAT